MTAIFIILFIISLLAAIGSMKDLRVPKEILKMIAQRRMRGSIVFFGKRGIKHYSSSSKSSR